MDIIWGFSIIIVLWNAYGWPVDVVSLVTTHVIIIVVFLTIIIRRSKHVHTGHHYCDAKGQPVVAFEHDLFNDMSHFYLKLWIVSKTLQHYEVVLATISTFPISDDVLWQIIINACLGFYCYFHMTVLFNTSEIEW